MSTPTYYQTLGVAPSATHDEVRQAYRDLARRLHPDRQAGASAAERALAERRMREINAAWKVLGDRPARTRYDQALARAERVGSAPPRPRPSGSASAPEPGRGPVAPARVDDGDDDLVEVVPDLTPMGSMLMRALPWLVVLGVLGLIFVITAFASGGRSDTSPTTLARVGPGACIVVRPGPQPVQVDCASSGAQRVLSRVDPVQPCPPGSDKRQFHPDPQAVCLSDPHP